MRLGFPRIKSLRTDDGAASIAFLAVDLNRDTGGLNYLFRLKAPSGETEIHTTVAIATSFRAAEKFSESGNEFWSASVTMEDREKYTAKYAEEHGNTFEVRSFRVPSNTSDDRIVALRNAFFELFFKYWSSYKYNNADDSSDPSGSYPDTINFVPFNLNRKFHVTLHTAQGVHYAKLTG